MAVPYLEKAAELGVPEAAHNIGYLLLNGLHPFKPGRLPGLAYGYFLKAANLGSLEGALMASDLLSRGIQSLDQRPDMDEACRFALWIAGQTPRLGVPLHSALSAYFEGNIAKSFLHYAIASEVGNDVAIFNTGYLCENYASLLVKAGFISNATYCSMEMYLDVANMPYSKATNAPSHALLWLGHEAVERNYLDTAADFYADALLAGADEGYFDLAWLAEERQYHIPYDVFLRLVQNGDTTFAHELASKTPSAIAQHLLDACMAIDQDNNGNEMDEDGYLSLGVQLPEGYYPCGLYLLYINTRHQLHAMDIPNFDIVVVTKLLFPEFLIDFIFTDIGIAICFLCGFLLGVVILFPLLHFIISLISPSNRR